jgi:hypothetical protein
VALLITVVLGDKVEVLATDDDGALHLGRDDLSGEDTTTDRDIAGEGALLVDVVTLNGLLGGLEAKTDLLVPAVALDGLLAGNLGVLEDTLLLLESLLNLLGLYLFVVDKSQQIGIDWSMKGNQYPEPRVHKVRRPVWSAVEGLRFITESVVVVC